MLLAVFFLSLNELVFRSYNTPDMYWDREIVLADLYLFPQLEEDEVNIHLMLIDKEMETRSWYIRYTYGNKGYEFWIYQCREVKRFWHNYLKATNLRNSIHYRLWNLYEMRSKLGYADFYSGRLPDVLSNWN